MFDDTKTAAEGAVETTSETEVKKEVPNASEVQGEANLLDAVVKMDAELEKLRVDRDNYRRAALKAKGKAPKEDEEESTSDESVADQVKRLVAEQLLDQRESTLKKERDSVMAEAQNKIKELSTALRNRGGVASTSGGASTEEVLTVKDNTLSASQIAELKAKGWDDAKIERFKLNLKK